MQEPGRPPPSSSADDPSAWVASGFSVQVCGVRLGAKGAKTAMQAAMGVALLLAVVLVLVFTGGSNAGEEAESAGDACECVAVAVKDAHRCEGHSWTSAKCTGADMGGRCVWGWDGCVNAPSPPPPQRTGGGTPPPPSPGPPSTLPAPAPAPTPFRDTGAPQAVVWKNLKCVTGGAGGRLTKKAAGGSCKDSWMAGAISTKVAHGDTEVQFNCSTSQNTMLGFSQWDSSSHYADIECALYADKGTLRAYENGQMTIKDAGKYTASSMLAVRRRGTTVQFLKDGKIVGTCGHQLYGRIFVDSAMYIAGLPGALSAQWTGRAVEDTETKVVWRAFRCTKLAQGRLIKHDCGKGWNAGAESSMVAPGDATLNFVCETSQHSFVGLTANANTNSNFKDIQCALYCDEGQLRIFEQGVDTKWRGPRYTADSILAVKRAGTTVTYHKNGQLLKTCKVRLAGNIMADVSFHSQGQGGIKHASWFGRVVPNPKLQEAVVWTLSTCAKVSDGGQVLKQGCSNGWTAGATSAQVAVKDGELSLHCTKRQHSMIGFSSSKTCNPHYNRISCALYCDQGTLRAYEKGKHVPIGAPSYDSTCVLGVRRRGSKVYYLKDGKILKQCQVQMPGLILAKVSIHNEGKGGILSSKWIGEVIPNPVLEAPVLWKGNGCVTVDEKTGKMVKKECGNSVSLRLPACLPAFCAQFVQYEHLSPDVASDSGHAQHAVERWGVLPESSVRRRIDCILLFKKPELDARV